MRIKWPVISCARERGEEAVEIAYAGRESKTGGWEYEDYVCMDDLIGVEGERDYWKAVAAERLVEA